MRLGLGIGLGRLQRSSIDPAAAAYFAATGITGATEKAAINTLVTSLKSAGLWSKMKAVYPFVTDNRNLLSYTEAFDNATWVKTNSLTVAANSTTAPDGTTTADTLINSSGIAGVIRQQVSSTVGQTYTFSVYVKCASGTVGSRLRIEENGAGYPSTVSDITVTTTWQRVSLTRTLTATGVTSILCDIFPDFATQTNKQIFVWGAQFETGTLTTYQPIATTQQSFISNQFKYNLVNPVDSDAAFRGVFNGGWTFSNQGATPNGTNGYMDTKLLGGTDLLTNNAGMGIYSGSNTTSTGGFGFGPNLHIYPRYSDDFTYYRIMSVSGFSVNNGTALGMMHGYSDGTNGNGFFNGTKKGTSSVTAGINAANLFFGGQRPSSGQYDNKQLRFAFASLFLTDAEAVNFYNVIQSYQTTLSRNV